MSDTTRLTAEEFATEKDELPDGGRWVELVEGQVITYQPPDVMHGNVVMNLSKQLADSLQAAENAGYACFELGLVVARNPDTVRMPQVCYYQSGERFAETDAVVTEQRPTLVVEVASTNDRRRDMAARVSEYLRRGVERVWVIDTVDFQCIVHTAGQPAEQLTAHDTLSGGPILPDFQMCVEDLFTEPKWWQG
ncbi:MAG: Uma2 family endonuclease [Planctomycetaceae bacterium]|jgi:Uma2 family endonuclease|nr:Uma2 family endonuclease [Planctomycetaceae bacterium]MBT6484104.1 Uma2 family endonuclease [Planctomycetaceae bacterium]MBT6496415.1 Uma2 family endonuclease [Planctomycetaceae bacterium]